MSQYITRIQAMYALGCLQGGILSKGLTEEEDTRLNNLVLQIYTYIDTSMEGLK